jgi:hypothetical protein
MIEMDEKIEEHRRKTKNIKKTKQVDNDSVAADDDSTNADDQVELDRNGSTSPSSTRTLRPRKSKDSSNELPKKKLTNSSSSSSSTTKSGSGKKRKQSSSKSSKSTVKKQKLIEEEEPEQYVVEGIMNHKKNPDGNGLLYYIKWLGFPKNNNTWEPSNHSFLHHFELTFILQNNT